MKRSVIIYIFNLTLMTTDNVAIVVVAAILQVVGGAHVANIAIQKDEELPCDFRELGVVGAR